MCLVWVGVPVGVWHQELQGVLLQLPKAPPIPRHAAAVRGEEGNKGVKRGEEGKKWEEERRRGGGKNWTFVGMHKVTDTRKEGRKEGRKVGKKEER